MLLFSFSWPKDVASTGQSAERQIAIVQFFDQRILHPLGNQQSGRLLLFSFLTKDFASTGQSAERQIAFAQFFLTERFRLQHKARIRWHFHLHRVMRDFARSSGKRALSHISLRLF